MSPISHCKSNLEILEIARLDLLGLFFDCDRIVLHHLDVREHRSAGLCLHCGMSGVLCGEVAQDLLTFAGLGIFLWYNRPPDDKLPSETRDDNRDGMR